MAQMLKEQTVAEQQASFEREVQVKEAEKAMRVSVAEANAAAVDGENIAEAKVAQSQATLLVQKAEAYEKGETRKRAAEAAVIEAQNLAMAKAALADADRIEAEQRAKYEAPAKAAKRGSSWKRKPKPKSGVWKPRGRRPPSTPSWPPKRKANTKS